MKKKLSILLFAVLAMFMFSACDNGKDCNCTTVFSDGRPNEVEVHSPLDKTTDPDCSVHEGDGLASDGVTTTTTTCFVE